MMSFRNEIGRQLRTILCIVAGIGFCVCGFFLAVYIIYGPTIGPDDMARLERNLRQLDHAKARWVEAHGNEQSTEVTIDELASYREDSRALKSAFRETYHPGPPQTPTVAILDRRVEYHNNGHTPEFGVFPKGTVFSISDGHLKWWIPVTTTE